MTFRLIKPAHESGYRWYSDRYQCTVCGRQGYGARGRPFGWYESCARGHAPCAWCGRMLAVRKDGTARVHTQCPERPEDAELIRAIAGAIRVDARLSVLGPIRPPGQRLIDRLGRWGA